MKYRVKEKDGLFYPQYYYGWKTLWSWNYFHGPEFKVLYRGEEKDPVISTQIGTAEPVRWRFKSLERASAFIEVVKIERLKSKVKYHDNFTWI